MDGSLAEKLYDWPSDAQTEDDFEDNKLSPRQVTEFKKNEVTYINGKTFLVFLLLFFSRNFKIFR